MALSAWVKPSSDPMAILVIVLPSSVAKSSTRPKLKKNKYDQEKFIFGGFLTATIFDPLLGCTLLHFRKNKYWLNFVIFKRLLSSKEAIGTSTYATHNRFKLFPKECFHLCFFCQNSHKFYQNRRKGSITFFLQRALCGE